MLFSEAALLRLRAAQDAAASQVDARQADALALLLTLPDLINQSVGDALSDALFVSAVLSSQGWTLRDWDALYSDLPSMQSKVLVKDRSIVVTANAERECVAPAGLQAAIDAAVGAVGSRLARAFVRPSGTEDVVRVYAEADTPAQAQALALSVGQALFDLAGGVGARPH